MANDIRVIEVPLSVAHDKHRFDVGAPAFTILQVDSPATIRVNSHTADPVNAVPSRWCGPIRDIYVSNEAANVPGAKLILVVQHSLTVEPTGGGVIRGVFQENPSTLADGTTGPALLDERGRLVVTQGTALIESEDSIRVFGSAGEMSVPTTAALQVGGSPVTDLNPVPVERTDREGLVGEFLGVNTQDTPLQFVNLDSSLVRASMVAYRVRNDSANGADVSLMARVGNAGLYIPLVALDETGAAHASDTVTVPAAGEEYFFLTREHDSGVFAAFQWFGIRAVSTVPGSAASLDIFASMK